MTSAQLILCAAMAFLAIQMAACSPTYCGYAPSCHGYGGGYGSGYDIDSSSGYGYGTGCSKVVKLPIIKKTTVVRQPFVHETRQAVVTVHEPSVKKTHADRPQVSSYVQKSCKSYVENEAPVVVPHPVIPTPTCDDHEGSYYSGSYSAPSSYSYDSAPASYSNADISYSTPEVYSAPHSSYGPCSSCGQVYPKGNCGCHY